MSTLSALCSRIVSPRRTYKHKRKLQVWHTTSRTRTEQNPARQESPKVTAHMYPSL